MKWTIPTIALMLAAPPSIAAARGNDLKDLNIHTVYVYPSMVHPDDAVGQQDTAWVKQAMSDVMGWTVTRQMHSADAVVILVPHGAGYQGGHLAYAPLGTGVSPATQMMEAH